jgi:hypothetical protein
MGFRRTAGQVGSPDLSPPATCLLELLDRIRVTGQLRVRIEEGEEPVPPAIRRYRAPCSRRTAAA